MDPVSDNARPELPPELRRHVEPRFGFSVAVPRRFFPLANTADPVARMMRGPGSGSPGAQIQGQRRWPEGHWDRDVMVELDNRRIEPGRWFELDVVRRDAPLHEAAARGMWLEARRLFPDTLETVGLPGFSMLDVLDTSLGALKALGFEYRWDAPYADVDGGDHGLLVWAPTPTIIFHLYHHCPETEWAARKPELDAILASFRVLAASTGEGEREEP